MVLRWKQWALNWTNMRTNPIYLHFYVHKVFLFFFFTCFDFLQNTASRWYLSWFMGFKHSFIFSPKVNECLVPCSHHLRLVPVPGVWVVQMSPSLPDTTDTLVALLIIPTPSLGTCLGEEGQRWPSWGLPSKTREVALVGLLCLDLIC